MACTEPGPAFTSMGPSITSVSNTDAAETSSSGWRPDSTSSGTSGGAAVSSTGVAEETNTGAVPPDLPSFDTEGTIGCQKIDVLFVVDDTGDLSSGLDQTLAIKSAKRVTDSANELLAVLQAQQFDYDLQVMVVKGDEHWEGKSKQCCEPGEFCGQEAPYPACNGVPIKDLTLCDSTLGAGVVYPVGFMASNVKCPMSEGRRYIGAGDDLASLFDCVIKVGRTGGDQDLSTSDRALGRNDPGDFQIGRAHV